MNRKHCLALGIVLAVGPHIAEAAESESSIVAPSNVRDTSLWVGGCGVGGCPLPPLNLDNFELNLPFPWNLCGLFSFVEIAFTGCLLTCFMPSRRRRIRA